MKDMKNNKQQTHNEAGADQSNDNTASSGAVLDGGTCTHTAKHSENREPQRITRKFRTSLSAAVQRVDFGHSRITNQRSLRRFKANTRKSKHTQTAQRRHSRYHI